MALNKLLRRHLNYVRSIVTYKGKEGHAEVHLSAAASKHADVYNKIITAKDWSKDFWEDLHKTVQQENVNEKMISSTIIRLCLTNKNISAAILYIKFLRDNNYDINVPIMLKLLELYINKETLTESEKADILQIYETVTQQCSHWSEETRSIFVQALSVTDRWKESCQILDSLTKFKANTAHASIINAAFCHNSPDIGWKYLNRCPSSLTLRKSLILTGYLQYCEQNKEKFNENMEKMFQFLREQHINLNTDTKDAYIEACNKFGWLAQLTTITRGKCEQCSNPLLNLNITEKEFELLQDAFKQKAVFGHDVYQKTTPAEWQRFQQFLHKNKPFDIVIDGLNINYYKKRGRGESLLTAVRYFEEQNKTVLIIARHHMIKRLNKMLANHSPYMFLVNNITEDDIFTLYATLQSGYNCAFVSLDLMRQHKFKLEDNRLKNIFINWQLSRQYRVTDNGTDIIMIKPQQFERIAQKSGSCWHIPFIDHDSVSYEFPNQWICFNMKPDANLKNS